MQLLHVIDKIHTNCNGSSLAEIKNKCNATSVTWQILILLFAMAGLNILFCRVIQQMKLSLNVTQFTADGAHP